MAANEMNVNKLLDTLADMLVENRALKYAVDEMRQYLPNVVHDHLLAQVEGLKADPDLRGAVAARFVQFRGQSIDDILPELLKKFPKIRIGN